jgi:hypothetical protein
VSSARQVAVYWGVVALVCLALAPLAPRLAGEAPACPVKTLSGLPCPSCGATRATLALAGGAPLAALGANPLVTLAWTALIVGGLVALAMAVCDAPLPSLPRRLPLGARLGVVALLVANWLYLLRAGI